MQWYADRLTEEQQATLRAVLQEPLNVGLNEITTFTEKSAIGQTLLRRMLVLFWGGPNEDALFKALRSSLLLAATDEEGLTVMNAIKQYPLTNLRIDLGVGLTAAQDIKRIIVDDEKIFVAIEQMGAAGLTAVSTDELSPEFLAPREPGSLQWEKQEITFTNPERGPEEQVIADIYVPQGLDSPAPLIVISHGFASSRTTFSYLAQHLASHGFAVAALEHPGTDAVALNNYINLGAPPPSPKSYIQRPKDITVLLDTLEQKVSGDPAWQGKLLTDNVGVFGQSLGGYTVLAAGGAQLDLEHLQQSCQEEASNILPFNLGRLLECQLERLPEPVTTDLQDDRVAAVLAVNPTTSSLFGPDGMSQLQLPVMMVGGTHDIFAPAVDEQITPFTWLQDDEKYLVLVEKGTHFSFLGTEEAGVFQLPQQILGPDPKQAHPAMQWMALTFFNTYVNGSDKYASFLEDLLLPSSSGDFKYALTRSLTQEDIDAALKLTE